MMNAAGNETRMGILYVLWCGEHVRGIDLTEIPGMSPPAVSQQLKKLEAHDLVRTRRCHSVYYSLSAETSFGRRLTVFFNGL